LYVVLLPGLKNVPIISPPVAICIAEAVVKASTVPETLLALTSNVHGPVPVTATVPPDVIGPVGVVAVPDVIV
jgi:hypothetical protein